MTKITMNRTLRRETNTLVRGTPLVLELGPHALTLRPKGARWSYQIDYDSIFALGAKKEAERKRQQRILKRIDKRA